MPHLINSELELLHVHTLLPQTQTQDIRSAHSQCDLHHPVDYMVPYFRKLIMVILEIITGVCLYLADRHFLNQNYNHWSSSSPE